MNRQNANLWCHEPLVHCFVQFWDLKFLWQWFCMLLLVFPLCKQALYRPLQNFFCDVSILKNLSGVHVVIPWNVLKLAASFMFPLLSFRAVLWDFWFQWSLHTENSQITILESWCFKICTFCFFVGLGTIYNIKGMFILYLFIWSCITLSDNLHAF